MIMTRDDNNFGYVCFWDTDDLSDLHKDECGKWESKCYDCPTDVFVPKDFKETFPNTPLPRKGSKNLAELSVNLNIKNGGTTI